MSKSPRLFAILVRGSTYRLRDQLFERGKPVAIDAATRAHLEQHAVDFQTVPTEDGAPPEIRAHQKFNFSTTEAAP